METKAIVYVTSSFIGFHRWKEAPDSVAFLRRFHRHIFGVKLMVNVSHGNREVEFFILKRELARYLNTHFYEREFDFSCEQIAEQIIKALAHNGYDVQQCEVNEDNENGAIVVVTK